MVEVVTNTKHAFLVGDFGDGHTADVASRGHMGAATGTTDLTVERNDAHGVGIGHTLHGETDFFVEFSLGHEFFLYGRVLGNHFSYFSFDAACESGTIELRNFAAVLYVGSVREVVTLDGFEGVAKSVEDDVNEMTGTVKAGVQFSTLGVDAEVHGIAGLDGAVCKAAHVINLAIYFAHLGHSKLCVGIHDAALIVRLTSTLGIKNCLIEFDGDFTRVECEDILNGSVCLKAVRIVPVEWYCHRSKVNIDQIILFVDLSVKLSLK